MPVLISCELDTCFVCQQPIRNYEMVPNNLSWVTVQSKRSKCTTVMCHMETGGKNEAIAYISGPCKKFAYEIISLKSLFIIIIPRFTS